MAHLYKKQIYSLEKYLNIPDEIATSAPTADTYSTPQSQDEFYFALPYQEMDLALWSINNEVPASDLAKYIDITENRQNKYTLALVRRGAPPNIFIQTHV